jgi:endonuclease/exonuclease/phosphatase (EEP) superfamily protein YafD
MAQLIAFTPYVAGFSALVFALTVLWRQWDAIIAAGVIATVLIACVLPRALPDFNQLAGAKGPELRVLTVNLLAGNADFGEVLRLAQKADVVVVQELTMSYAAKLEQHFPYHVTFAAQGVGGAGIYSRLELTEAGRSLNPLGFGQVSAELPQQHVFIESVHPVAPSESNRVEPWRESFRRQKNAQPDGPMWILAGDFNATLDHSMMRHLIRSGYRDAAAVKGKGLTGTWGPYDGDLIPPVTLDRVLADRRLGVKDVQVFGVRGSDHRAVLVTLVLP